MVTIYGKLQWLPWLPYMVSLAVACILSCRYGDLYPKTPLGMIVGSIALMLGLVLMALPVTIIVAKFSDEYERSKSAE